MQAFIIFVPQNHLLLMLKNHPLRAYNTFGLAVKAKLFAEATDIASLKKLCQHDGPKYILGGGSNVLFKGDYPGLILRVANKGIQVIREDAEQVWVEVQAGEAWHQFVLWAVEHELGGVENLSLIPGTVGAAPMQNIGAYGVEIESVFDSLEAIEIATGQQVTFFKEQCKFGYRESIFKQALKNQFIIASVTFRLQKNPQLNISYGDISKTLEEMGVQQASLRQVSDAVIQIRRSKLPDPAELGNAGSFFKNPVISQDLFAQLQAEYPTIPNYPAVNGVKIPAGWLIEQDGWKGKQVGNTGCHARQALVLVNYGNATGQEILDFSTRVIESVHAHYGVRLDREVNVV
jgi:UDP-N-acetylmuramate dehydrogenase